jgi:hypothetical protein
MRKFLVLVLTFTILMSTPTSFSATPKVGGTCTKNNQVIKSGSQYLVCAQIKGKKTWTKANQIQIARFKFNLASAELKKIQDAQNSKIEPTAPAIPKQEDFTFYVQHTLVKGGGNDELLKITLDSNNKIVNRRVVLKASTQSYFDSLSGMLLFSAGSSGNFYLLDSLERQTQLSIKSDSSITGDERRLALKPKFYGSTSELLFWDYNSDLYRVSNIASAPVWEKIIDGKLLKTKLSEQGLDSEREWLDDFVVVDRNKLVVATSNNTTDTINLWSMSLRGSNDFSLTPLGQYKFQEWTSLLDMAISPDKSKVAFKYAASELTPNFRIVILDVANGVKKEVPTIRHHDGFIGPLTFIDNDNLLLIPALIWPSDPDGGRVICRLDLRVEQKCMNIVGLSGLEVQGLNK